ncbi:formin (bud-site selection/polarity protein), putative [Sugiyamaella lignohabitans]|uniref:Formin (Bud-site selection/polarity protein), putative n=1 Tax=Sugiyamaella lignohabitans TaxID=796027 RepID=A0A167CHF4_9ASCO|nr:formin (bud-site selection/polarity protein), putative [Sugiyamaella lignohabitans]ANB11702.1 formin (bud-site selection/polarity protein), putative [Sugiyamaella lignohabitans]
MTGIVLRDGNRALITCGMVSPIMTQNAMDPPNANRHCANDIAIRPGLPKQCFTVAWNVSVPLILAFVTMSRIVQSITTVSDNKRNIPASRPACLTA